MKTVLEIIERRGGLATFQHAKIANGGYMPLVIEQVGTGPNGFPLVSVAHYFEQNGDLMSDPEMTFEVAHGRMFPVSFTQHSFGLYQVATWQDEQGRVLVKPRLKADLAVFARTWDRNLKDQGFLKAAEALVATT